MVLAALTSGCLESTPVQPPPATPPPRAQGDSVVRELLALENSAPGDSTWNRFLATSSLTEVAAYLSASSVAPGDTVSFFGISQDSTLAITVFRIGWYSGTRARRVLDLGTVSVPYSAPCTAPVPGPSECVWPAVARIPIASDAVPGVYVVRYEDRRGAGRVVPLVVKAREQASIVVVLSFNTYQAYNSWGGASLYLLPDATAQAPMVSFLRPYTDYTMHRHFLLTDLPLVSFLEKWLYPAFYVADVDFDGDDQLGAGSRLVIFSGHGEYWTSRMRDHAERLRGVGVGLAFFGANDVYWQVRYAGTADGYAGRLVVCYKSTADPDIGNPALATVRFRDPEIGRPENALIGVMHAESTNVVPYIPLVVGSTNSTLFLGTGFAPGDKTTAIGGWEGDKIFDNGFTPGNPSVLFQTSYQPAQQSGVTDTMDATFYMHSSGAGVFAAGTIGWSWALAEPGPSTAGDVRVQQFTRNLLNWYLR